MNPNTFEKLAYFSKKLNSDIFAIANYIDDCWEYYVFIEFNHKQLNGYNTFKGIKITDEVNLLNQNTFREDIFANKIEKLPIDLIKFPHSDWIWIRSDS